MESLEQQQALAMARARQRLQDPNAKYKAMSTPGNYDPTSEMSFGDKFLAGAGKAASDMGLGARQVYANVADAISPRQRNLSDLITGRDPSRAAEIQQEVDEVKQRDQALMNTGAGMAGNIAGNVGMAVVPGLGVAGTGTALGLKGAQAAGRYALSSPLTVGGAATQGGMGAVQAGLQPVATGESRASNAAAGFLGGAAIPVGGMALRGGKAAVEPLYEGGRNLIVGRALNQATGESAPNVIQNLRGARELVPGSSPTAAEVGQSGGLAAMQRAAKAVDPESYTVRELQQNEARTAALQGLTGTSASREAAEQARETTAGGLYKQARAAGVDREMAQAMKPQIDNLMERMPSGVLDKAKELARLNGEAMDAAGSVNGLHWIKLAVDDMLSSGKQTGIGTQTTRALSQFKSDLLSVVDELSPLYKQGRETFQRMSKPINQMDIAQAISDKSVNKLTGQIQPQAYARALSDDTAARATGFNKATLSGTMEPQQLATLNAIKEDLARSVAARDLGRGAGSDTVQKLAMTNLAQRAGLPVGVVNLPGAGRLGNWMYEVSDEKMRGALAKALLNPKETAAMMERATPSERAKMIAMALRSGAAPIGVGSVPALLDAP